MAKRALSKMHTPEPIRIGAFVLTSTGMTVNPHPKERPSFAEYERVGDFIKRAHQASGFWLADFLAYGETREDWRERLSQAHDVTGISEKTLKNIRAIGRAVDISRRRDGIEFSVHGEVTRLPPAEQEEWLEKAETEQLSVQDLRHAIRTAHRRTVLQGRADNHFTVDVTVAVDVEAENHVKASEIAWDKVKRAIQEIKGSKVLHANCRDL